MLWIILAVILFSQNHAIQAKSDAGVVVATLVGGSAKSGVCCEYKCANACEHFDGQINTGILLYADSRDRDLLCSVSYSRALLNSELSVGVFTYNKLNVPSIIDSSTCGVYAGMKLACFGGHNALSVICFDTSKMIECYNSTLGFGVSYEYQYQRIYGGIGLCSTPENKMDFYDNYRLFIGSKIIDNCRAEVACVIKNKTLDVTFSFSWCSDASEILLPKLLDCIKLWGAASKEVKEVYIDVFAASGPVALPLDLTPLFYSSIMSGDIQTIEGVARLDEDHLIKRLRSCGPSQKLKVTIKSEVGGKIIVKRPIIWDDPRITCVELRGLQIEFDGENDSLFVYSSEEENDWENAPLLILNELIINNRDELNIGVFHDRIKVVAERCNKPINISQVENGIYKSFNADNNTSYITVKLSSSEENKEFPTFISQRGIDMAILEGEWQLDEKLALEDIVIRGYGEESRIHILEHGYINISGHVVIENMDIRGSDYKDFVVHQNGLLDISKSIWQGLHFDILENGEVDLGKEWYISGVVSTNELNRVRSTRRNNIIAITNPISIGQTLFMEENEQLIICNGGTKRRELTPAIDCIAELGSLHVFTEIHGCIFRGAPNIALQKQVLLGLYLARWNSESKILCELTEASKDANIYIDSVGMKNTNLSIGVEDGGQGVIADSRLKTMYIIANNSDYVAQVIDRLPEYARIVKLNGITEMSLPDNLCSDRVYVCAGDDSFIEQQFVLQGMPIISGMFSTECTILSTQTMVSGECMLHFLGVLSCLDRIGFAAANTSAIMDIISEDLTGQIEYYDFIAGGVSTAYGSLEIVNRAREWQQINSSNSVYVLHAFSTVEEIDVAGELRLMPANRNSSKLVMGEVEVDVKYSPQFVLDGSKGLPLQSVILDECDRLIMEGIYYNAHGLEIRSQTDKRFPGCSINISNADIRSSYKIVVESGPCEIITPTNEIYIVLTGEDLADISNRVETGNRDVTIVLGEDIIIPRGGLSVYRSTTITTVVPEFLDSIDVYLSHDTRSLECQDIGFVFNTDNTILTLSGVLLKEAGEAFIDNVGHVANTVKFSECHGTGSCRIKCKQGDIRLVSPSNNIHIIDGGTCIIDSRTDVEVINGEIFSNGAYDIFHKCLTIKNKERCVVNEFMPGIHIEAIFEEFCPLIWHMEDTDALFFIKSGELVIDTSSTASFIGSEGACVIEAVQHDSESRIFVVENTIVKTENTFLEARNQLVELYMPKGYRGNRFVKDHSCECGSCFLIFNGNENYSGDLEIESGDVFIISSNHVIDHILWDAELDIRTDFSGAITSLFSACTNSCSNVTHILEVNDIIFGGGSDQKICDSVLYNRDLRLHRSQTSQPDGILEICMSSGFIYTDTHTVAVTMNVDSLDDCGLYDYIIPYSGCEMSLPQTIHTTIHLLKSCHIPLAVGGISCNRNIDEAYIDLKNDNAIFNISSGGALYIDGVGFTGCATCCICFIDTGATDDKGSVEIHGVGNYGVYLGDIDCCINSDDIHVAVCKSGASFIDALSNEYPIVYLLQDIMLEIDALDITRNVCVTGVVPERLQSGDFSLELIGCIDGGSKSIASKDGLTIILHEDVVQWELNAIDLVGGAEAWQIHLMNTNAMQGDISGCSINADLNLYMHGVGAVHLDIPQSHITSEESISKIIAPGTSFDDISLEDGDLVFIKNATICTRSNRVFGKASIYGARCSLELSSKHHITLVADSMEAQLKCEACVFDICGGILTISNVDLVSDGQALRLASLKNGGECIVGDHVTTDILPTVVFGNRPGIIRSVHEEVYMVDSLCIDNDYVSKPRSICLINNDMRIESSFICNDQRFIGSLYPDPIYSRGFRISWDRSEQTSALYGGVGHMIAKGSIEISGFNVEIPIHILYSGSEYGEYIKMNHLNGSQPCTIDVESGSKGRITVDDFVVLVCCGETCIHEDIEHDALLLSGDTAIEQPLKVTRSLLVDTSHNKVASGDMNYVMKMHGGDDRYQISFIDGVMLHGQLKIRAGVYCDDVNVSMEKRGAVLDLVEMVSKCDIHVLGRCNVYSIFLPKGTILALSSIESVNASLLSHDVLHILYSGTSKLSTPIKVHVGGSFYFYSHISSVIKNITGEVSWEIVDVGKGIGLTRYSEDMPFFEIKNDAYVEIDVGFFPFVVNNAVSLAGNNSTVVIPASSEIGRVIEFVSLGNSDNNIVYRKEKEEYTAAIRAPCTFSGEEYTNTTLLLLGKEVYRIDKLKMLGDAAILSFNKKVCLKPDTQAKFVVDNSSSPVFVHCSGTSPFIEYQTKQDANKLSLQNVRFCVLPEDEHNIIDVSSQSKKLSVFLTNVWGNHDTGIQELNLLYTTGGIDKLRVVYNDAFSYAGLAAFSDFSIVSVAASQSNMRIHMDAFLSGITELPEETNLTLVNIVQGEGLWTSVDLHSSCLQDVGVRVYRFHSGYTMYASVVNGPSSMLIDCVYDNSSDGHIYLDAEGKSYNICFVFNGQSLSSLGGAETYALFGGSVFLNNMITIDGDFNIIGGSCSLEFLDANRNVVINNAQHTRIINAMTGPMFDYRQGALTLYGNIVFQAPIVFDGRNSIHKRCIDLSNVLSVYGLKIYGGNNMSICTNDAQIDCIGGKISDFRGKTNCVIVEDVILSGMIFIKDELVSISSNKEYRSDTVEFDVIGSNAQQALCGNIRDSTQVILEDAYLKIDGMVDFDGRFLQVVIKSSIGKVSTFELGDLVNIVQLSSINISGNVQIIAPSAVIYGVSNYIGADRIDRDMVVYGMLKDMVLTDDIEIVNGSSYIVGITGRLSGNLLSRILQGEIPVEMFSEKPATITCDNRISLKKASLECCNIALSGAITIAIEGTDISYIDCTRAFIDPDTTRAFNVRGSCIIDYNDVTIGCSDNADQLHKWMRDQKCDIVILLSDIDLSHKDDMYALNKHFVLIAGEKEEGLDIRRLLQRRSDIENVLRESIQDNVCVYSIVFPGLLVKEGIKFGVSSNIRLYVPEIQIHSNAHIFLGFGSVCQDIILAAEDNSLFSYEIIDGAWATGSIIMSEGSIYETIKKDFIQAIWLAPIEHALFDEQIILDRSFCISGRDKYPIPGSFGDLLWKGHAGHPLIRGLGLLVKGGQTDICTLDNVELSIIRGSICIESGGLCIKDSSIYSIDCMAVIVTKSKDALKQVSLENVTIDVNALMARQNTLSIIEVIDGDIELSLQGISCPYSYNTIYYADVIGDIQGRITYLNNESSSMTVKLGKRNNSDLNITSDVNKIIVRTNLSSLASKDVFEISDVQNQNTTRLCFFSPNTMLDTSSLNFDMGIILLSGVHSCNQWDIFGNIVLAPMAMDVSYDHGVIVYEELIESSIVEYGLDCSYSDREYPIVIGTATTLSSMAKIGILGQGETISTLAGASNYILDFSNVTWKGQIFIHADNHGRMLLCDRLIQFGFEDDPCDVDVMVFTNNVDLKERSWVLDSNHNLLLTGSYLYEQSDEGSISINIDRAGMEFRGQQGIWVLGGTVTIDKGIDLLGGLQNFFLSACNRETNLFIGDSYTGSKLVVHIEYPFGEYPITVVESSQEMFRSVLTTNMENVVVVYTDDELHDAVDNTTGTGRTVFIGAEIYGNGFLVSGDVKIVSGSVVMKGHPLKCTIVLDHDIATNGILHNTEPDDYLFTLLNGNKFGLCGVYDTKYLFYSVDDYYKTVSLSDLCSHNNEEMFIYVDGAMEIFTNKTKTIRIANNASSLNAACRYGEIVILAPSFSMVNGNLDIIDIQDNLEISSNYFLEAINVSINVEPFAIIDMNNAQSTLKPLFTLRPQDNTIIFKEVNMYYSRAPSVYILDGSFGKVIFDRVSFYGRPEHTLDLNVAIVDVSKSDMHIALLDIAFNKATASSKLIWSRYRAFDDIDLGEYITDSSSLDTSLFVDRGFDPWNV